MPDMEVVVSSELRIRGANNIAELRALSGVYLSGKVEILGFASPGDGGGGVYRWDSASSLPHDGWSVLSPNSAPASGRWIRQRERSYEFFREDFSGAAVDATRWEISNTSVPRNNHRDNLLASNVSVSGGLLRIKTPANSYSGGEIKSLAAIHKYGSYTVRMRANPQPGVYNTMFLWIDPDFYSEIDIEVFKDKNTDLWRCNFVTYQGDLPAPPDTNQTHVATLDFDPSSAFHDYRFDYHPDYVEFYIDGKFYWRVNERIPPATMHLFAEAWWPTFLQATQATVDTFCDFEYLGVRSVEDTKPQSPHKNTHYKSGADWVPPIEMGAQPVGARVNAIDANQTLLSSDEPTQRYTGVGGNLTATRRVTLPSPGYGKTVTPFRIVRHAGDTGGPWNLEIYDPGPASGGAAGGVLRNLTVNQWADVEYDGYYWGISAYGSLNSDLSINGVQANYVELRRQAGPPVAPLSAGARLGIRPVGGHSALEAVTETGEIFRVLRDQIFFGLNNTGAQINKGTLCRITGYDSAAGVLTVAPADNTADSTMHASGFAAMNIPNGSVGRIWQMGLLTGLNTSGMAVGSTLYLGTAGAFTTTRPVAPGLNRQVVGEVAVTDAANGIIHANVSPSYEAIGEQKVILGSDVANGTTSYADVTGLSFAVVAGPVYRFYALIPFTVNANTTGARFSMNGPAKTRGRWLVTLPANAVPAAGSPEVPQTAWHTGYNTLLPTTTGTPTADENLAIIEGFVQPSAAGMVVVRFASEVAVASGVVVKAGSTLSHW